MRSKKEENQRHTHIHSDNAVYYRIILIPPQVAEDSVEEALKTDITLETFSRAVVAITIGFYRSLFILS